MSDADRGRKPVEAEAKEIRAKYGDCSELYAEGRSEAAEMAGEEEDSRHWDRVADAVAEEPGE